MLTANFTHVFAVPGSLSIVDAVHPDTGRSMICDHDLAAIQARYPGAVLMSYDDWAAARAMEQDTPVTWSATTAEQFEDMLNVLPPAAWVDGAFLVGEPTDHHVISGRPRFTMYRQRGDSYEVASRPVTRREFQTLRNA